MAKKWWTNWTLMALFAFVVEMIVLTILAPNILDLSNLTSSLNNFLVIGMVALPMALVIISGGIDLSIGSIISLSGVVMGWSVQHGMNIWLACLLAIVVGAIAGWINGQIIVLTGIQPLIATLATMFIYGSLALAIAGQNIFTGFPESYLQIGNGEIFGFLPTQLFIFIILTLVFWFLLHKTVYGRMVFLVGNNEESARYSGVPVHKIKIWTYVASGAVGGLGAIVLGSYFAAVRGDLGISFEFLVITACLIGGINVFGGAGSMTGVVIGVFILGMLNQSLNILNVSSVEQKLITGVILLLAVVVQQFNVYFTKSKKPVKKSTKEVSA